MHQALLLRQWSDDVSLVLHDLEPADLGEDDRTLLAARGVHVVDGRAQALAVAREAVTGVRLTDGREVACAAVFVAPRFRLRTDVLTALCPDVVENDMGEYLATDDEGRTSVPGLWAVGNVADLSAQVLGAAELGSRAAIGLNGELVAPALIRSELLCLLYRSVRAGELSRQLAESRLDHVRSLRIRLLGDRVLQRVAWDLAEQLSMPDTLTAEYLALTRLQADAFVTLDGELARVASVVVPVATVREMLEPDPSHRPKTTY